MKRSKFFRYFASKPQAKPADPVKEPEVVVEVVEAVEEPVVSLEIVKDQCDECVDENCERPCDELAEEEEVVERLLVRDAAKSLKISNKKLVGALKEIGVKATHASKITVEELEEAKKVLK